MGDVQTLSEKSNKFVNVEYIFLSPVLDGRLPQGDLYIRSASADISNRFAVRVPLPGCRQCMPTVHSTVCVVHCTQAHQSDVVKQGVFSKMRLGTVSHKSQFRVVNAHTLLSPFRSTRCDLWLSKKVKLVKHTLTSGRDFWSLLYCFLHCVGYILPRTILLFAAWTTSHGLNCAVQVQVITNRALRSHHDMLSVSNMSAWILVEHHAYTTTFSDFLAPLIVHAASTGIVAWISGWENTNGSSTRSWQLSCRVLHAKHSNAILVANFTPQHSLGWGQTFLTWLGQFIPASFPHMGWHVKLPWGSSVYQCWCLSAKL